MFEPKFHRRRTSYCHAKKRLKPKKSKEAHHYPNHHAAHDAMGRFREWLGPGKKKTSFIVRSEILFCKLDSMLYLQCIRLVLFCTLTSFICHVLVILLVIPFSFTMSVNPSSASNTQVIDLFPTKTRIAWIIIFLFLYVLFRYSSIPSY